MFAVFKRGLKVSFVFFPLPPLLGVSALLEFPSSYGLVNYEVIIFSAFNCEISRGRRVGYALRSSSGKTT